jgi:two-component sensor histidine kinase
MVEQSLSWLEILGLFLLPFPVLALVALSHAMSARRQLAQNRALIDDLGRQAIARDEEIAIGKVGITDAQVSHEKLTREFHHRVKNSLQVIQSYLALSRRQKTASQNVYLAEAEAKVKVISAAYRFALSEGIMNPVPIRKFVTDIIENAQAILCGNSTRISATIEPDSVLVLDRAIPLGLSIIEVITAALATATVKQINVRITQERDGEAALIVTINDAPASISLPLRLMAGLQSQLDARAQTCVEGEILHWIYAI